MSIIRPLYRIKNKFEKYEIYIWNINCDSELLFIKLLFRMVDIKGFVVPEDYINNSLFVNSPVISIDHFEKQRQGKSLVVYADGVQNRYDWLKKSSFCISYSELIDNDNLNPEIFDKNINIYGVGKGAELIADKLNNEGKEIKSFFVSDEPEHSEFLGKPVYKYNKKLTNTKECILVSTLKKKYKFEILKACSLSKADVYICFDDLLLYGSESFPLAIDKALKNFKRIIICGRNILSSNTLVFLLKQYGIVVDELINPDNEIHNKTQYDRSLFIIDAYSKKDRAELLDFIKDLGVNPLDGQMNATGFFHCGWSDERIARGRDLLIDPLLHLDTYSIENNGWIKIGNDDPENIKIAILGDSVSEYGMYSMKMWPELLYEKLINRNIKVEILNGASSRATSMHSLIKLIRDGYSLKPDIVVCMSGGNNTVDCGNYNPSNFPIVSEYNISEIGNMSMGINTEEDAYDFWLRTIKLMKLVSENIGSKFYAFLEPINTYMENMTIEEKAQFEYENRKKGAKSIYNKANDNELYSNLNKLFNGSEHSFIDAFHPSEKCAEIIAEIVFKKLGLDKE